MSKKEALFSYPIEKFLGLNVTKSNQSRLRNGESSYMKNFCITDTYALKKRDGLRLVHDVAGKVRTAFMSDERVYVVVGNSIYTSAVPFDSFENVGSVDDSDNCFFVKFGGNLYLWGGGKIQVYSDDGKFKDIEPYRPLIAVSCVSYSGDGTPFEDINMLTSKMRKQYSPQGAGDRTYILGVPGVKQVDYVKYRGETVPKAYYIASKTGIKMDIDFSVSQGINTIEIGFTLEESDAIKENYSKVVNCRYNMFYGGENDTKIFLWGNPDYPDSRIWSDTVDGISSVTYFPESNYTRVGDGSKICDIVRQYDRQLIFCQNSAYLSYIENCTDALGRSYFSFPIRTVSDTKGSAVSGQSKLIGNIPITLMNDGLYKWVSTSQRDERNTVKISSRIDAALQKEDVSAAKMYDFEYKSELYIYFPNGRVYVYAYDKDVFYLYDNIFAHTFFSDSTGKLYFFDGDGKLYMFDDVPDDNGAPIECEWHSAYIDMGLSGAKNLYSVDVTYYPYKDTLFNIYWCADNDSDNFKSAVILPIGENNDSDGNVTVRSFKHRMRTKRFRHIKLIISDNSAKNRVHLHCIRLNGKYTDMI